MIWKRLLKIEPEAQKHCFWMIGQGNCFFWEDEWSDQGLLINKALGRREEADLVQDYGEDNNWYWDKLSSNLPVQVAIKVFLIPFNSENSAVLIWKRTSSGEFTTKSAWEIVRKKARVQKVLARCWGIRVPTTVAIFWWKVLHGWLPVEGVLQSRGIVLASKCQCCQSLEAINHVLLYNEEVIKVWEWFSAIFQVTLSPHISVEGRFKSWLYSSDCVGKSHIRILLPMLISWYSWLARNDARHNGKKITSSAIIFRVMSFLHLAHSAKPFSIDFWAGDKTIAASWNMIIPSHPVSRIVIVYWKKPPPSWIKINTDGSFCHFTKRAATGGVIRDEDGRILRGFQAYIGQASILYAELTGIWLGLKFSQEMGFNNVIIESDSKVVVLLITKTKPYWHWSLVNIISKIIRLCQNRYIKMSHVFREGNKIADEFAKAALASRTTLVLEPGEYPILVRQIAYGDKNGLAYIRKKRTRA